MTVESLQQRLGGRVRDGDGWDLGNDFGNIRARRVFL
jgi:hypothetical protein